MQSVCSSFMNYFHGPWHFVAICFNLGLELEWPPKQLLEGAYPANRAQYAQNALGQLY